MRRNRLPQTAALAAILAACLIVALGLGRSTDRLSRDDARIPRVASADPGDPAAAGSARATAYQAASSASRAAGPSARGAPSPAGAAPAASAVFDLATLAPSVGPEPTPEPGRFRTNDEFTPDDLAHPERYF